MSIPSIACWATMHSTGVVKDGCALQRRLYPCPHVYYPLLLATTAARLFSTLQNNARCGVLAGDEHTDRDGISRRAHQVGCSATFYYPTPPTSQKAATHFMTSPPLPYHRLLPHHTLLLRHGSGRTRLDAVWSCILLYRAYYTFSILKLCHLNTSIDCWTFIIGQMIHSGWIYMNFYGHY